GRRGVGTDGGRGMSGEVRLRAFDPFFTSRVDQTGAGLGLSIVRSIIQGHSGTIEIEPTEGEGTTVVFTIPALP
nr:HAMP domain-containing histidine kinase [Planctomycetota bacterium]